MHITPRLETARPGKAAAGSLPTGVNQQGPSKASTQRPLPDLQLAGAENAHPSTAGSHVNSVLGSHYQVDIASEEGFASM